MFVLWLGGDGTLSRDEESELLSWGESGWSKRHVADRSRDETNVIDEIVTGRIVKEKPPAFTR